MFLGEAVGGSEHYCTAPIHYGTITLVEQNDIRYNPQNKMNHQDSDENKARIPVQFPTGRFSASSIKWTKQINSDVKDQDREPVEFPKARFSTSNIRWIR